MMPPSSSAAGAVAAGGLLDLMNRLMDVLAEETALLRDGRVGEIAPLQSEKTSLATRYAAAIKALGVGTDKASSLSIGLRVQLAARSKRLAELAQENADALRVGGAATRMLLEMVIESLGAQRRPTSGYTATLAPARSTPLLAVALDRRL
ncbi:MAG TPA: hypothetical protein VJ747_14285 [Stellaceae bacterium]|nr:hypothetical protein [Stellaceae bacterium]